MFPVRLPWRSKTSRASILTTVDLDAPAGPLKISSRVVACGLSISCKACRVSASFRACSATSGVLRGACFSTHGTTSLSSMSLNIIASSSLLLSVFCNKCDCDESEFCDPEDPSSVNEGMLFVFLAGSGGTRKEKVELPAPVTVLNLSSVRFRGGSLAVDGVVTGVWARLLFLARAPWRSKKSSASLSLALHVRSRAPLPTLFGLSAPSKSPWNPSLKDSASGAARFFMNDVIFVFPPPPLLLLLLPLLLVLIRGRSTLS